MFTLTLPYYNQPEMLARQIEVIERYPAGVKTIVVDDGSKIPAKVPAIDGIDLYRINQDIPWNRSQARNLGAYVAETEWVIQTDIDHILPLKSVESLLSIIDTLNPKSWYRFPRYRIGKADFTRKKDNLPDEQERGEIHPHMDSYLITRDMFMQSPYDERYSGCLGGGSPFIARLIRLFGEPKLLPKSVCLEVYTTDKVRDASITSLSRDTSEYQRRRDAIEASGNDKPLRMLCHPWHKVC